MIRIDKSLFSAEELLQYQALVAKAAIPVDDENEAEYEEDEKELFEPEPEKKAQKACNTKKSATTDESHEPNGEDMTKSFELPPQLTAAITRLEALEKSIEMNQFTELAKKYAPLGEKEDELAKTLYTLKKSNEEGYNAYVAVLDKSLGLVEKSGLFAEIGKSASGGNGDVTDRINNAAAEIRKSDPSISYAESIAKAWHNNPDLIAEYEEDYSKGR